MRLLLDTHAFLLFVLGDAQLSSTAKSYILDSAHTKLISPASYWEIAIKVSIGKYTLNTSYELFTHRASRGMASKSFLLS
jgi:PIN domain nuclease of toxin-antitoxin system